MSERQFVEWIFGDYHLEGDAAANLAEVRADEDVVLLSFWLVEGDREETTKQLAAGRVTSGKVGTRVTQVALAADDAGLLADLLSRAAQAAR
jgi:hypothetical protein